MKKPITLFTCSHCTAQFQKWIGRCLECGKWGTIEQEVTSKEAETKKTQAQNTPIAKTTKVGASFSPTARKSTKITELDNVLGGGLVPGSFILLGGEPGIGKSTLSTQIAQHVPQTIYFSGEESIHQIGLRIARLAGKKEAEVELSNETNAEVIAATIKKTKPPLVIVDSIQTIRSSQVESEPGNISQVRACATILLDAAKTSGTAIILIGHVTKDGNVAGPRTLEHLVDTVLYLEGDRYQNLRILRAVKNRFGSTDEIGMFEMDEEGLREVPNPSELLLAERGEPIPGSVVTCLMEGSRPLLVEVQALVNKTAFGFPVRKASGFDINRLHVLIAVLEKRAGLSLGQCDVHINIVGGVKAAEPAADLAICLAIASACKDKTLGNDVVVFGEVGLGGEVRSIRFLDKRIRECEQLGMKRCITKNTSNKTYKKIKVVPVKTLRDLISIK
ncbi:MAG: DNA repair protein RadA [Candidatus Magasanikbacteria bacterium]|jgi:DNA repair protein RadA/Sms|nr:DNA repair protein RadA [Candidatus Magasanikbacteria bacterium]MBT6294158.1 DNA repair protein RadA [Candidatus Magasanikbacteria bacterium]